MARRSMASPKNTEHHLRQALVLDGLHEPLGDGVHVRRAYGGQHGLDASARQRLAERLGELRVAIDDEVRLAAKEAVDRVGEVAREKAPPRNSATRIPCAGKLSGRRVAGGAK